MTAEQEQALKDLRNGCRSALEGVPDDRRAVQMVVVSAAQVVCLCDLIDELASDVTESEGDNDG